MPAPFYFIVSFWGAAFREYFLRLSAASLMAPGNAPSLTNLEGSRVLVCTTRTDWAAIQGDPTFRLLSSCITPEFIELRRSVPDFLKPVLAEKWRREGRPKPASDEEWNAVTITPDQVLASEAYSELEKIGREIGAPLVPSHHYALRIFFMSNGHKAGASKAFADGANAVFLGPDLVMADGAIPELERIVASGRRVVLTATLRFDQEKCLAAFRAAGQMEPGRPLALKPRDLAATVFPHMHPETACFEFDSPYFCDTATSSLWRVPGDDGILLHNLNFYPLLINYAGVRHHHTDYFDIGGTIDGRYVAMHFDPKRDIEVIDDSDRLMLASFTPGSEYYYPVATDSVKTSSFLGDLYKIHLIRKTLYSPMGDNVKRHFYTTPLRLHSKPLTPLWDEIEERAKRVAASAVTRPTILDTALDWLHRLLARPAAR